MREPIVTVLTMFQAAFERVGDAAEDFLSGDSVAMWGLFILYLSVGIFLGYVVAKALLW